MADEKSNVNGEKKEEKVAIWGAIIQGVVSIVGSIFDNKSKNDALKAQAKKEHNAANTLEAGMAANGMVLQGGVWVPQNYKPPTGEYGDLLSKKKKAEFGGSALTETESARLKQLAPKVPMQVNAVTNPTKPPKDGGLSFGGSNWDPFGLGEVEITADGKPSPKTAGMSPLIIIGLLSGGAFMLYKANKPKGKRRR